MAMVAEALSSKQNLNLNTARHGEDVVLRGDRPSTIVLGLDTSSLVKYNSLTVSVEEPCIY